MKLHLQRLRNWTVKIQTDVKLVRGLKNVEDKRQITLLQSSYQTPETQISSQLIIHMKTFWRFSTCWDIEVVFVLCWRRAEHFIHRGRRLRWGFAWNGVRLKKTKSALSRRVFIIAVNQLSLREKQKRKEQNRHRGDGQGGALCKPRRWRSLGRHSWVHNARDYVYVW